MKKLLLVILIAITPISFFGCGDSEELAGEDSVVFEKLEGVVRKLGVSIYQQGTHHLEKDGALIVLLEVASLKIKLDGFIGEKVEVEGIISPTVEGNFEIMKVVAITSRDDSTEGKLVNYERYEDSQFGFSVRYPNDLKERQTRRGVAFFDEDEKTIEVVVLENTDKQKLSDWLIDNYGYTAAALQRVSIAGLIGYQFQNTTGSVIYLDNETQVFTLAWYDNSEINRARNRRYYLEFVQSFSVARVDSGNSNTMESSNKVAAEGEFCGGIAGIACAGSLTCRLSGNYPDAGGICVVAENSITPGAVTSDQIAENDDLLGISAAELQRGWYYGDRDQKKPGTPMTWILVNSGSRSAMWRRLDDSPVEPTVELQEATTVPSQLSTEQREVLKYLQINIASLAPETPNHGEWELSQLAFADPNFVYAIYIAGDSIKETQTRRLLFVYTVVNGEVRTEMQTYFRPGAEQDWIVVEGSDIAFGEAQKIVDASGKLVTNISEGYRLFTDYRNGFSLQYPKNWYWSKPSTYRIEFSDKPFPAGIPLLVAKIVPGRNYNFNKLLEENGKQVIYVAFDSNKSVRISAEEAEYEETLLVAAQTFRSE